MTKILSQIKCDFSAEMKARAAQIFKNIRPKNGRIEIPWHNLIDNLCVHPALDYDAVVLAINEFIHDGTLALKWKSGSPFDGEAAHNLKAYFAHTMGVDLPNPLDERVVCVKDLAWLRATIEESQAMGNSVSYRKRYVCPPCVMCKGKAKVEKTKGTVRYIKCELCGYAWKHSQS